MFSKEELIFRFNEGMVDIALLLKSFSTVKLKEVYTFATEGGASRNGEPYNTEENVKAVKEFVSRHQVKNKQAKVVLSLEGIITRLVECPVMNKRDLEKFIHNNIDEYFTLNINDYYYDYKILDREKGENNKFVILLVVFPKLKLEAIGDFVKACGLEMSEVSIYPEAISSLFHDNKEESLAVFDVGLERNSVTILEKGRIFLYSRMNSEVYSDREESYEEILENMGYFLNFYAARHYSNRVDKIYIIGEYWNDDKFYNLVKEQFGIETAAGIKLDKIKILTDNKITKNLYCDLIGVSLKVKSIYNKNIDLGKVALGKKEANIDDVIKKITLALLLMTLLWNGAAIGYSSLENRRYDVSSLNAQIKGLSSVEKEVNELNASKKDYEKKQQYVKAIESDKFNYVAYLDALKGGIPSNAGIKTVTVDKEKISVVFSLSGSTLDKLNLIIAINNLGIFETLELNTITLNDNETEAPLTLKIKKPL